MKLESDPNSTQVKVEAKLELQQVLSQGFGEEEDDQISQSLLEDLIDDIGGGDTTSP